MIFVILIVSFILRVISLNQSLWFDESVNVVNAQMLGFSDYLTKYTIGDFHPAGYFIILWLWGHLFGFSEISVRMPSVIFGVLSVFFTYLTGRELYNKKTGLIAALLLSLSPLHIYYSQEARMYSLAVFAATFSIYSLILLIKGRKVGLFLYPLSIILVLYSDYVTYLIIPAQIMYVLLYKREFTGRVIVTLFIGALSFLPWLPIFLPQLKNGNQISQVITGWRQVVGGTGVRDFLLLPIKILIGRITFDNKIFYSGVILLTGLLYLLSLVKVSKHMRETALPRITLLLPPLLAFVISFFIPIFSYFRLIFILPSLYLLMCYGLSVMGYRLRNILLVLILMTQIVCSGMYLFIENNHRENWREVAIFLNRNVNQTSYVVLENNEITRPLLYYSINQRYTLPGLKAIPTLNNDQLQNLDQLKDVKRVYLVEYLIDVHDPKRLLGKRLEEMGFKKGQVNDFRGVGFVIAYDKQ